MVRSIFLAAGCGFVSAVSAYAASPWFAAWYGFLCGVFVVLALWRNSGHG